MLTLLAVLPPLLSQSLTAGLSTAGRPMLVVVLLWHPLLTVARHPPCAVGRHSAALLAPAAGQPLLLLLQSSAADLPMPQEVAVVQLTLHFPVASPLRKLSPLLVPQLGESHLAVAGPTPMTGRYWTLGSVAL